MNAMHVVCILSAVAINTSTMAFPQTEKPRRSNQSQESERIFNGEKYDHEKYPYLVAIHIKSSICTGTMISPLFVLTAAHCTNKRIPSHFTINLGAIGAKKQEKVTQVFQHPSYDPRSFIADISLLKLKSPFPGLNRFAVISGHPDEFANAKELNCVSIGFGATTEKGDNAEDGLIIDVVIRHGKPPCKNIKGPQIKEFLCTKPNIRTVCAGDSGGPLICGEYQYGLTSFTMIPKHEGSDLWCGSEKLEDFFIFIHNYKEWIYSHVNNSCSPIVLHHKFGVILVTFLLCVQN